MIEQHELEQAPHFNRAGSGVGLSNGPAPFAVLRVPGKGEHGTDRIVYATAAEYRQDAGWLVDVVRVDGTRDDACHYYMTVPVRVLNGLERVGGYTLADWHLDLERWERANPGNRRARVT